MPHYFFNLAGKDGYYSADEDGVAFRDVEAAYLDVHRAILDISFDMLRARRDPASLRFEVTDQTGVIVLDVPFTEVLRPGRMPRDPLSEQFRVDLKREMQRSQTLKADLSQQIADAHVTIEKTRQLLSRARPALGRPDIARSSSVAL